MTRSSSALNAGWGSERAIASTPRIRPSRVRTGQERNDELLYQSHSRSASAASRRSNRRLVQARGARPVLDALDPHRAAGLDRGLGDARALGLVGPVEHGHERVAHRVGGEPRRGGADVGVRGSTTRNETPVTSSSRRTCDTISSSVRRSQACDPAACSMPRSSNMRASLTARACRRASFAPTRVLGGTHACRRSRGSPIAQAGRRRRAAGAPRGAGGGGGADPGRPRHRRGAPGQLARRGAGGARQAGLHALGHERLRAASCSTASAAASR